MKNLLIQEQPLTLLPSLLVALNGNYAKAIVLQQIHFMTTWPKSGVEHEGHHWIWFTYDEFVADYTPWMSTKHLQRCVLELEKDGLLISTTRVKDKWDNTKYYRVNYYHELLGSRDETIEGSSDATIESSGDATFLYTEYSTEYSSSGGDGWDALYPLLKAVGIIIESDYKKEKYIDLVDTYGFEAVARGVQAAADNMKQHHFSYVATCVKNIATGVDVKAKHRDKSDARAVQTMMFAN